MPRTLGKHSIHMDSIVRQVEIPGIIEAVRATDAFRVNTKIEWTDTGEMVIDTGAVDVFVFVSESHRVLCAAVPVPFDPPRVVGLGLTPYRVPPDDVMVVELELIVVLLHQTKVTVLRAAVTDAVTTAVPTVVRLPSDDAPVVTVDIVRGGIPGITLQLPPEKV